MIAKAKKLRSQGRSQEETAKELGIHVNSLIRWLKAEPAAKTRKSAPKKSPAKTAKAKARGGARRYTPEQKQAMRDKARAMLKQGKSKLAIQEELGIAYKTLDKLLKGAKTAKAAKKGKLTAVDPIDRMADIRKRILQINEEMAALNSEKANLQKEMKAVYKRLGDEITGQGRRA
jgi:hypothetical protein